MELTLISMLSKTKKVFTTHLPVSVVSLRIILLETWKIERLSLLLCRRLGGGMEISMKRKIIITGCFLLIAINFVSCNSRQEENVDKKTVVWDVTCPPGFEVDVEKEIFDNYEEKLNAILSEKKAEYKIEIQPIAAEEGKNEVELLKEKKSKKEQTDVITVLGGYVNTDEPEQSVEIYKECVENQILNSLDMLLETDAGKELQKVIPKEDLENAKIDGKTYGISAVLPVVNATIYSKDTLQETGIDPEKLSANIFENEELFREIKEKTGITPYQVRGTSIYEKGKYWMNDICPVLAYREDTGFTNLLGTKEYRVYMENMWQWKQEGLLKIQEYETEENEKYIVSDEYFIENYRTERYEAKVINSNGKEETLYVIPNTEQFNINPYWGDNKSGIASWSENKENAEDFLVRLFTDEEIANLLQYGEEGTDYAIDEEGKALVKQESSIITRYFGYQYTNPMITYSTPTMPEDKLGCAKEYHEKYEGNLPRGFRLDITPIVEEIKAVNQIYDETLTIEDEKEQTLEWRLFSLNVENIDQTINEIVSQMNDAGMEKIVEEANRQLKEWKEKSGQ